MDKPIEKVRVSSYSRAATSTERTFYGALIAALVARRHELRMTQEDLDFKLQVSEGQVAKWETFSRLPGAFMMVCWSQALDVSLSAVVQTTDAHQADSIAA